MQGGPQPSDLLSGNAFREAIEAAAEALDHHAAAINALNVFPVPDGDTGTNMALTARAASEGARAASSATLGDVVAATAHGALMGARGNSGVILAQLLRGFARQIGGAESAAPSLVADALAAAADAAYSAVADPIEGTVLTVARAAGNAAVAAAREGCDLLPTLERAHEAARCAVELTPEQLPILKQAGVVDSGGEGYRVFLRAILGYARGEAPEAATAPIDARADLSALHDDHDTYGYCTEVLFQGTSIDLASVRRQVEAIGSSVLVVGDASLLKVHVHTLSPGRALEIATQHGELVQVKVDNLRLQREAFSATPVRPTPAFVAAGTSVVAVAIGGGFQELFASLGAIVVEGGSSMNPSVEQIRAAIEASPNREVVVLPNNPNVMLTSKAAAGTSTNRIVEIVPTRTMPEGVAAALALNPVASAGDNVRQMCEAAERCHTIALTRAARDAVIDGVPVRVGAALALLDGATVGTGTTFLEAVPIAMARLEGHRAEIATIYVGQSGEEELARTLAAAVHTALDVSVEIAPGGQPHYDYIISVE